MFLSAGKLIVVNNVLIDKLSVACSPVFSSRPVPGSEKLLEIATFPQTTFLISISCGRLGTTRLAPETGANLGCPYNRWVRYCQCGGVHHYFFSSPESQILMVLSRLSL